MSGTLIVRASLPVATFQTWTDLSLGFEASRWPSGENEKRPLRLSRRRSCFQFAVSQKRIRFQSPPDANVLPSGEKARRQTAHSWPTNSVNSSFPVWTFQNRTATVPAGPTASVLPSAETAIELAPYIPPSRVNRSLPLATSQMRSFPSRLLEISVLPSGVKMKLSSWRWSASSRRTSWPLATSERVIVSPLPDATVLPSGENAMLETESFLRFSMP